MDDRKRQRIRAGYIEKARKVLSHLDEDEQASVRGLQPLVMKRAVPEEHEEKLVELGLVERKLGGLRLTVLGEFVAEMLRPI